MILVRAHQPLSPKSRYLAGRAATFKSGLGNRRPVNHRPHFGRLERQNQMDVEESPLDAVLSLSRVEVFYQDHTLDVLVFDDSLNL